VNVAEFASREQAEEAWAMLVGNGVPSTVLTESPPWGEPRHQLQCARGDAAAALVLLSQGQVGTVAD